MKLERIKNLREDSDMSQAEFAKILNISQRTLSHYECGTRDIPIEVLTKIADYFECTLDYLVGRSNQKNQYDVAQVQEQIPQYHPSYTKEENFRLHKRIETATDEELVEWIQYLCGLFSGDEKKRLDKAMNQLILEISERNILKQKYDLLMSCRNEWETYCQSLYDYQKAVDIRARYRRYKADGKKIDKEELLLDSFIRSLEEERNKLGVTDAFIRRCTFKEDSSQGIKKGKKPDICYSSLKDVKVNEISKEQALKILGTESLKELLTILLQNVDTTGNENKADFIISFLTRIYARVSHKKEKATFTTTVPDYNTLLESCLELLEEIKAYKKEAESYEEE